MNIVCRLTALFLAVCLLCTGCRVSNGGGGGRASSMKLVKTEGGVAVTSDKGRNVNVTRKVSLYAGYGVATETQSYAWIDLDDVKLTKLDEKSDIRIDKKGKKLEVYLNAGGIFFNVTEPLEEDETLNIRTATMVVGIRGTCGWVYVQGEDALVVSLLEGTVTCTVVEEGEELASRQVTAGETATMTLTDGEAEIKVTEFTEGKVPAYVREEVQEDRTLSKRVEKATGFDLSGPADPSGPSGPGDDPTGSPGSPGNGDPYWCVSSAHSAFVDAMVMGDGGLMAQGSILESEDPSYPNEYKCLLTDAVAVYTNRPSWYKMDMLDEDQESESDQSGSELPVCILAAISKDGSLYMWGDYETKNTPNNTPKKVSMPNGEKVVKFNANGEYAWGALTESGTLFIWGYGNVTYSISGRPSTGEDLMFTDVADFSLCDTHVAIVKTDGTLWTWGNNNKGQLGTGDIYGKSSPVHVMDDVRSVRVADDLTVALKTDGTVWLCGSNQFYLVDPEGESALYAGFSDTLSIYGVEEFTRRSDISGATAIYTDGRMVQVLLDNGDVIAWGKTNGMTATESTALIKFLSGGAGNVKITKVPQKLDVTNIVALDGDRLIDAEGNIRVFWSNEYGSGWVGLTPYGAG